MDSSDSSLAPCLIRLARDRGGLITARSVEDRGISRATLRQAVDTGRLIRIAHGAYVETRRWTATGERARHLLRLRAVLARTPAAVAVAQSAAVVFGLPLPTFPEQAHILVPRTTGPDPGPGAVRGRGGNGTGSPAVTRRRATVRQDEVLVVGDLRTTCGARTVMDCARHLDLPWGLAVADAACRTLILSRDGLRETVERGGDVPGRLKAAWVAAHALATAESPLESLARAVTMLGGFPEPRTQVEIETRFGPFRVDLLDRGGRVVTEADGRSKYSSPRDVWQEKRREDALRDRGLEVLRFTYADYRDPGPWLAAYRRALKRAYG